MRKADYGVPVVDSDKMALHHPQRAEAQEVCMLSTYELKRMAAGQQKYGTSWAKVNLQQDLIDELSDALNYLYLIYIRLHDAQGKVEDWQKQLLHHMAKTIYNLLDDIEFGLPYFDGPTSEEWVKEQQKT